jgi:phosphocarrier protein
MKTFVYNLEDPLGIHARPAGLLAKEAAKYKSTVTIIHGEKKADTRRLIALMALGLKGGDTITVQAEGPDEAEAADGIRTYLTEKHY